MAYYIFLQSLYNWVEFHPLYNPQATRCELITAHMKLPFQELQSSQGLSQLIVSNNEQSSVLSYPMDHLPTLS